METLAELQIWIEGQFALIRQAQETAHTDLTTIRSKVHELSNDFTKIHALNIPDKLARMENLHKEHETAIDSFKDDLAARKGALAALKAVYLLGGAAIGGIVTVVLKLYAIIPG